MSQLALQRGWRGSLCLIMKHNVSILTKATCGGFPNLGLPFGGPYNKGSSYFGVYIGVPYFGKVPNLQKACVVFAA